MIQRIINKIKFRCDRINALHLQVHELRLSIMVLEHKIEHLQKIKEVLLAENMQLKRQLEEKEQ